MRIEYVPLNEITKWATNPKLHDEKTLDSSIERFGYVQPLLFDETTQKLVAGHGRLESLHRRFKAKGKPPERIQVAKNGTWLVPVIRGVSFANEREAAAYLVADNRLVELGGWDEGKLAETLAQIKAATEGDDPFAGMGYTAKDFDALLADVNPEKPVKGATPEDLIKGFNEGAHKPLLLYLTAEEHRRVISLLELTMMREAVLSPAAAVTRLLDQALA